MRQIVRLFFLIAAITVTKVSAQNYTVGTPVNDTLTTSSYNTVYNCYPDYDFYLNFPYSTVTGVDHILIFTSVTPQNSIYTVPGDTINTGDTLHFSQSQDTYNFYFPANGTINYIFKAIGTPQIANESYACGNWLWIDGASTCFNYRYFIYDNTCTVSDTTTFIDNVDYESNIILFPNPVRNILKIKNTENVASTEIEIFNILGNIELFTIEKGEEIYLDISNFPSGLYIVEFRYNNKTIRKKIIKEH